MTDVVIVGAGVVGAACALELASRGASVEVLEAAGGWGLGCSAGNAGLVVPSHATPLASRAALWEGLRCLGRADSPFGIRLGTGLAPWLAHFGVTALGGSAMRAKGLVRELAVASLESWRSLAPHVLEQRGVLNVYAGERGFAAGRGELATCMDSSLRYEVLDGREALSFEPALRGPMAGAIFFPDEAHGDPRQLVRALGDAAEARGVRLRTGVTARGLRRGTVRTDAGDFSAGAVVVAGGVASSRLGLGLPLIGGRGYSVDVLDGLARPRVPVFLQEARVVATPLGGRTRLAGTLELTSAGENEEDRRRMAGVEGAGRRHLGAHGSWRAAAAWSGLRPCAPDGLPIVGALPARPDVVVATGHAMLGLTLAPVTGSLVADALEGRPTPPELSPARFRSVRRACVAA